MWVWSGIWYWAKCYVHDRRLKYCRAKVLSRHSGHFRGTYTVDWRASTPDIVSTFKQVVAMREPTSSALVLWEPVHW